MSETNAFPDLGPDASPVPAPDTTWSQKPQPNSTSISEGAALIQQWRALSGVGGGEPVDLSDTPAESSAARREPQLQELNAALFERSRFHDGPHDTNMPDERDQELLET